MKKKEINRMLASGGGDVKICGICDGLGKLYSEDRYDDVTVKTCNFCWGSGRMIHFDYHLQLPITFDKETEFYEMDKKIHNMINELENKNKEYVD